MTPFPPTIVSRMTAATVCAPSYCEDLLEMGRACAHGARVGMPRGTAVRVGVEHANDSGHGGLGRPATRVAAERDRSGGRAVVRAVARDHLVAPRVPTREPDRVLVRLRAAVREERHRQVAGRDLGEQARELGALVVRHRRPDRRQLVRLLLDRGDDLRVLVPDRDVDELRGEVEVAVPFVVPEPAALGAGDRQRADLVLHRPGVQDVLLVELADPLPELRVALDDRHVRSFARSGDRTPA